MWDDNVKHETELRYLKNRVKELEGNIREVLVLLMQAGIVRVETENDMPVYKINKVKLDGE